ncbi:JmjC domain-containing protein [Streptomyces sp. NPDC001340]
MCPGLRPSCVDRGWYPDGEGFGVQCDDRDVIVIQIDGAKRWKLAPVEFVDRVHREGGPLSEAGVQLGGVQAVPDGVPTGRGRVGVAEGGLHLAVCGREEAGRFQPVGGQDGVDVVPRDQPARLGQGGGDVAVVVEHLGQDRVLAQVGRQVQRRSERLADPAAATSSTHYLCGTGGLRYADDGPFDAHAISVARIHNPVDDPLWQWAGEPAASGP